MIDVPPAARPLCSDASAARGEPLAATASRVEHWLLVECAGRWPDEPLDSGAFSPAVRDHLAAALARVPRSRLLLVKRLRRARASGVRAFYGWTRERERRFYAVDLSSHADLLRLDVAAALLGEMDALGEPLDRPLLLVCTHGTRDRCCARYGQALFRALHDAEPGSAWQSSHVGGDRFAANLVALPEGLYFGRVAPPELGAVLGEYRAGRIALDWYRGASCYPMAVQAAEIAVRRAAGLAAFDDLRFAGRDGDAVRFDASQGRGRYEARVRLEYADEEVLLTCNARQLRRPRVFVASEPTRVS